MEYDNKECIIANESDYPQNIFWKSLYENVEVNVKEEIEVREGTINTKSVDINLLKHELTHTEEKSFKYTICDKKIPQNCLIKHEIVHTVDKPCQCSQRGKTSTCKSSLVIHERTHTGEKTYQCSQFENTFSKNSHLITHQRTHHGEKPYQCRQCDKAFSQNKYFLKHQR
ncbi:unnamed protein product, partial [Meganyctiphanes norvegica]